jgi:hypothetical protein
MATQHAEHLASFVWRQVVEIHFISPEFALDVGSIREVRYLVAFWRVTDRCFGSSASRLDVVIQKGDDPLGVGQSVAQNHTFWKAAFSR